jgi:predicted phosphodiesterase
MTRIAVLSDLHANLPALEAVIADMTPFNVDHVIVAGDLINWGPFSVEVVERVTQLGWAIIRGNHEYYLLDYNTPRAPEYWKDFDTPPWLNQVLGKVWKTRIAAWPESISLRYEDAPPALVVHASPKSVWKAIYSTAPDHEIIPLMEGVTETTVICGHTHLPLDRQVGQWRILNPGAVGMPLDGQFSAGYMLLDGDADGWRPTFRRVPFDYAALFEAYDRIDILYQLGSTGRLFMEEHRTARPQLYPFNEWHRLCAPDEPRTIALAERFIREVTDKDQYMPPAYWRENLNGNAHRVTPK